MSDNTIPLMQKMALTAGQMLSDDQQTQVESSSKQTKGLLITLLNDEQVRVAAKQLIDAVDKSDTNTPSWLPLLKTFL